MFDKLETIVGDIGKPGGSLSAMAKRGFILLLGGVASLIYFVSAGETGRGCSLTVNMRIFQPSPSRT
jgi:hypothetical protein